MKTFNRASEAVEGAAESVAGVGRDIRDATLTIALVAVAALLISCVALLRASR